jgi:exonuclease I
MAETWSSEIFKRSCIEHDGDRRPHRPARSQGLLNKAEVLAEIKSLQQQLAQRTGELDHTSCPQPYLNVQVENALVDRILELFNATKRCWIVCAC